MAQIRTVLNEQLIAYLLANEPPEHEELCRLRGLTQRLPRSIMQIAPEQGHFLAFLIKLMGALRVLELGTFTGYSAMAMALALPDDGRLITCDLNDETASIGAACWQRAGVAHKIEVRIGPALATLDRMEREGAPRFDLVFIDADKPAYDSYYEAALRLVRCGGMIVLDNMFQRGEVSHPSQSDARTAVVRALNAKIASDERVDRVMLPVADGMTLARRRI
jgi:predicted O-methyltransferase YrrM